MLQPLRDELDFIFHLQSFIPLKSVTISFFFNALILLLLLHAISVEFCGQIVFSHSTSRTCKKHYKVSHLKYLLPFYVTTKQILAANRGQTRSVAKWVRPKTICAASTVKRIYCYIMSVNPASHLSMLRMILN